MHIRAAHLADALMYLYAQLMIEIFHDLKAPIVRTPPSIISGYRPTIERDPRPISSDLLFLFERLLHLEYRT